MFKKIIQKTALWLLIFTPRSFAIEQPAGGGYTHIYVNSINLRIWSSEKVVSVGGLKFEPPIFVQAQAEGEFKIDFDGGYAIRFKDGKLYYGDTLVGIAADGQDVYVTPKGYKLGVFIQTFDK